jgi:penicillin-binding protein 2
MFSIHRIVRTYSVLLVLFALLFTQTAFSATRHPAKKQSISRADRRQSSARGSRAERLRVEARRRAEAARLAAVARQRAADEALRNKAQAMIAKDDTSGEDPEIRRVAVNALGDHAGTVVVMDPQTGRIYSIVNQQWALHEGVKPCSTIKLVTGLAGLNEKVIDPADTTTISDSNRVTLTSALAHSKNEYFQTVGGRVGFSKMISYARQLGLGEKTGINVRNESQGKVPVSKSGFAVNHMSSHGDDFKVTAVQLATLVSAMANGGKLITPFVPRTAQDENRSSPRVRRVLSIDSDSFKQMVPGMIGSVSYGSGRRAFDPQEIVAGKTGTCIEQGTWIGLFTSYAPQNNPRLAVVVIARGTDGRNHFPAAVAGRIYRDLNERFATSTDIAASRSANPQTRRVSEKLQATEEKAAATDDEEKDDADDDATAAATANTTEKTLPGKTIWGDQRAQPDNRIRRTVMPIPSRRTPPSSPAASRTRTASSPRQ